MLEELLFADSESSHVAFLDEPRTPAGLIRLACALHAVSTSLAEICDLLEWFGVSRTRQAVHYWFHAYAEACEQEFTAEPDRVAVDEKQIQLAEEQRVWLYVAIDVDSKVVLNARLSERRGTKPATRFLRELNEEHCVRDAEFLVDGMGYLTALARTDLDGDLNYTERNVVEKLFQTYTMRIGRFHETWNGGQLSAERWLTAYTFYYNHLRSHQALDNHSPIEQLEDSI